jgi:LmbE family N-acetylglucosaminyl deacetylase
MLILVLLFLLIPLLWIAGFLLVTDFSVPLSNARSFHHILVIFPHADDEAVSCGGTLHRVARSGCAVTLVLLTRGERGTPDATLSPTLKDIREREAQTASTILGISTFLQEDFGDATLQEKRQELTVFLDTLIQQKQPDLLITYDLAGFYGHPDHIACSEVVTELQKNRFREIPLWYVTFPQRVLARVRLPEHMVTDLQAAKKRALPTHKLFIGGSVFPKIRSWYTYKSQRASLTKGIGKLLPLWFFLSMMLFEYFAEAR